MQYFKLVTHQYGYKSEEGFSEQISVYNPFETTPPYATTKLRNIINFPVIRVSIEKSTRNMFRLVYSFKIFFFLIENKAHKNIFFF